MYRGAKQPRNDVGCLFQQTPFYNRSTKTEQSTHTRSGWERENASSASRSCGRFSARERHMAQTNGPVLSRAYSPSSPSSISHLRATVQHSSESLETRLGESRKRSIKSPSAHLVTTSAPISSLSEIWDTQARYVCASKRQVAMAPVDSLCRLSSQHQTRSFY